MGQAIAEWEPRLHELARPFTGRAEVDDLVQEGRIAVWKTLARGRYPTDYTLRNVMRQWCRTLRRQEQGRTDRLPNEDW